MKTIAILLFAFAAYASAEVNKDCIFPCYLMLKPVCASDGNTYDNECQMRGASCRKGEALTVVRPGKCVSDENKRCMFICPMIYAPVCGSDGKLYPSECSMRGAACQANKAITVVRHVDVKVSNPSCEECNIACTREYAPVCGSDGKTHPTECVMRANACKAKKAIIVIHKGECKQ